MILKMNTKLYILLTCNSRNFVYKSNSLGNKKSEDKILTN